MERERPHSCDICGKKFHQLNQLRQHAVIHKPEDERPFGCYVCDKKFNRLHHLKLHLMVHSGQSPHTCEICGRTCNQLSDLKKHQMIHTGERPYSCPICGKGFIQVGGMKRHIEKHKEKKYSFSCQFCGKVFKKPSYLKKHIIRHENDMLFTCSVSPTSFPDEEILEQHENAHNERCYVCDKCDKTFKKLKDLEKHYALHPYAISYQCAVCAEEFFLTSTYKKHMEFHGIILSPIPEEVPEFDSLSSDVTDGNSVGSTDDNVIAFNSPVTSNDNVMHRSSGSTRSVQILQVSKCSDFEVPEKYNEDSVGSSNLEEQETDSIGNRIDDKLVVELANNVLGVPDECSLDDVSFDGNVYTVVVEKHLEEDLQELVNSVS